MLNRLIRKPILSCSLIFIVCSLARLFEYFYMRTDETLLSENFLHKLFGILLLWGILSICKLRWKDIGFTSDGIVSGVGTVSYTHLDVYKRQHICRAQLYISSIEK